jgi:hypothetical protein
MIGIKTADGKYYPVLVKDESKKKRLVLTTVRDNQDSVHIDLYQGEGSEMASADYIGSLVVDSIRDAEKGKPEIELSLGTDKRGNLIATAKDTGSGEYQSLSVSLESVAEGQNYSVPDFDLDMDRSEENFFTEEQFDESLSQSYSPPPSLPAGKGRERTELVSRRSIWSSPLLFIAFLLLGLMVIALGTYFIFKVLQTSPAPPLQVKAGLDYLSASAAQLAVAV